MPSEDYESYRREYHGLLGELASEAMERKAMSGEAAGWVPTGYLKAAGAVPIPDPGQAETILAGFRCVDEGRGEPAAFREVTRRGLLSRNGRPISVSAFRYLLRNPFYTGLVRYKGELYPGKHQAIVPPELFERVQRKLR